MTETLQDRLRRAADDNSDHPPIFGLYFEAADCLDELEASLAASRESVVALQAERERLSDIVRGDTTKRDAAWAEYLDLRKQIRRLAAEGRTDTAEQGELVARACHLAGVHHFDVPPALLTGTQVRPESEPADRGALLERIRHATGRGDNTVKLTNYVVAIINEYKAIRRMFADKGTDNLDHPDGLVGAVRDAILTR